ncbi:hypothetical protein [Aquimarina sp. 2201CG14-23]|uniref:hypothetical protein n=1 Tax=Aquimarina mycalae TaxID=3040073 RepID=UPI002477F216|nr:hypothetical protein [Aquimarina sp. 2201CG14-23]MDH7446188.1 hypothetical protein [Aquimarina sp. 2201CG14-23]
MRSLYTGILLLCCTISSCQHKIPIDDIKNIPQITENDQKYTDVFKILDGVWKGEFLIFEDEKQLSINKIDLKNISLSSLQKDGIKQVNSIQVQQTYTSKSPYFQTVSIIDYYPDTGQKIISNGVNKIQNGILWCVVKKPNETVIHEGSASGNTIIWQRKEQTPQKIEYFKETVSENFYEILGWGYYEGDNPELSPRLWFYAKYEKQK